MFRVVLLFFIWCLYCSAALGQMGYRNINTKHGLPISIVNDIVQDQRGFIWFGTIAGLCRFDGTTVTAFTSKDGCPENEILSLYVDKSGYMWISPYSGDLMLMRNDTFFMPENMPRLRVEPRPGFVSKFQEDLSGNVWVMDGNIYKYSKEGARKIKTKFEKQINDFIYLENDYYLLLGFDRVLGASAKGEIIDTIFEERELKKIVRANCLNLNDHTKLITFRNHNTISFYFFDVISKKITRIGNFVSDSKIYRVHTFDDNLLYICTSNGVLRFESTLKGLQSPPVDTLLFGKNICSVFKDQEGILWFATQNEGVYYGRPNQFNSSVSLENKNGYHGIAGSNDILILGGKNEDFYWSRKKDFGIGKLNHNFNKDDANFAKDYKCALYDGSRYFWLAGDGILKRYDVETNKIATFVGTTTAKTLAKRKNGKLLLGTSAYLVELNPNNPSDYTVLINYRTLAVAEDSEGNIWSGHLDGLYTRYKNGQIKKWGEQYPALSGKITDITISKENVAWIGTHLSGLFIIAPDTTIQISTENGMPSNLCNKVKLRGENEAFVTTNLGMAYIRILARQPFQIETRLFNTTNVLSSNDTWDMHIDHNFVYVTTLKGVERIDLNNLPAFSPPKVYLSKCLINNKPIADFDPLKLDYKQNNLSLLVSGISYQSQGNLAYKYMLQSGKQKEWITTSNPLLNFFELAPGDYQLSVLVQSSNGAWSTEPAQLSFHINPPVWETNQFRILVGALLFGSIFLFFRYYKQTIERENNQKLLRKQQMYDMEINAIKAQMNPHFIFNCLNAIQKYIVNKDFISSNHYLSSFSKLIRKSMELSKLNSISIAQELAFIEEYVKLESMRFDNSFEYKTIIDTDLNPNEFEIPTMLVQPLVENAINHGLLPMKEQQGIIELKAQKKDNRLIISITDNGIGIEESYRRKKNQTIVHNSNGILILQHRIAVINELLTEPIELKISNQTNRNNTGTIAELSLPLKIASPHNTLHTL